jgi:PTH2 family peptidyl-tRNA hydrolase
MPTKQVLVWRQDLQNVPKGKFGAQMGHAAHLFLTSRIPGPGPVTLEIGEHEAAWMLGNYRKVVAFVRTEDELKLLQEAALKAGLKAHLVTDDGLTVFDKPTVTCLGIGPDDEAAVDAITGEAGPLGKLRLL